MTFTPNAVIFSKGTGRNGDAYVFFFPEEENANAFRAECYDLHRSTGDVTAYTLKGTDTPTTLYYVAVPAETTMGLASQNMLHLLSEKGVEALRKHCREHDSKNPDALSREASLDQALLRSERDKPSARHTDVSQHNPNAIAHTEGSNSYDFIFQSATDAAKFINTANRVTKKGCNDYLVGNDSPFTGQGTYRITVQASDMPSIMGYLAPSNPDVQRINAELTNDTPSVNTQRSVAAPAPIPTPLPMPMPTPAPGPALPTNEQSSFAQRVLENRTHTQERSPSP